MAHLSIKENYMRMMRGEIPEYVPKFEYFWMFGPSGFMAPFSPEGWTDLFGVEFVTEKNACGGALPKPGKFILDDIRKWRDVIKRPAILDEVDWPSMSKKDLDNHNPEWPLMGSGGLGMGYFQSVMAFMGFNNGLVACLEEPEEVKALVDFLTDINVDLGKKFLHYYKPDMYWAGDDIAHERSPFVSMDTYHELFEPAWRANIAPFKEAGLPAQHHNCGFFEPLLDSVYDMGFNAWDPAQTSNDLVAVKKKYGRKLAIVGGIENNGWISWPTTSEEEVRAEVRRIMDTLAPDGGYAFIVYMLGPVDDPNRIQREAWLNDEYEKNMFKYYK